MPSLISSLSARVRAWDARRVDAALAAAALVVVEIEVAVENMPKHGNRLISALFAPAVLLLVTRRRWPALSAIAFVALMGIQSIFRGFLVDDPIVPFATMLFLNGTVAYEMDGRALVLAAAAITAVLVGAVATDPLDSVNSVGDYLWILGIPVAAPMAAGRALRSRSLVAREMREKAAALDRRSAEERAAAIAAERDRIARELHDVVAHDVSVMIVQASAARRIVASDPDRAARAISLVEGTGREALAEMRRVLGVLRRGDEDLALAPAPGLRHLDALVSRVRAGGLDVELDVEGAQPHLPAGIDLVAYRVLQDALDNAAHHARGGTARVRVRYEPRDIELEVADRPAPGARAAGDGTPPGLAGMRERVDLYGGKLWTERTGGGFTVKARLPIAGAAE